MKTYRVHFVRENGTEGHDDFTEKSEAAAKEAFRECYRHENYTNIRVEVVSSDKEEERKALAKIKKIIEGLGEDSYIATAFEGCFEIAEENIENDFACSMKQKVEAAEKELQEAKEQIEKLEFALKYAEHIKEELERMPVRDDFIAIRNVITSKMYESEEKASEQAEIIVNLADKPDSEEFAEAVRKNRAYKREVDRAKELIEKIDGCL